MKKVMTEKCQYLSPREQEIILNILKTFDDFLMVAQAHGIPPQWAWN